MHPRVKFKRFAGAVQGKFKDNFCNEHTQKIVLTASEIEYALGFTLSNLGAKAFSQANDMINLYF